MRLIEQIQGDVVSEDVVTELPPVLPRGVGGLLELFAGVVILRDELHQGWVLAGGSRVFGNVVSEVLDALHVVRMKLPVQVGEGGFVIGQETHVLQASSHAL